MAEYAAEGNTDYTDVTIFSVGAAFDYIIPSFHVERHVVERGLVA